MSAYARERDVACTLAREASALILRYYATEFTVVEKPDGGGPVTPADIETNELIVRGLRQAFPDDSIIAEESGLKDVTHSERRWFIDPIDGTREFVARNGMFAVHIGFSVGGNPVLGVVAEPTADKLYVGIPGEGTTVQVGNGPLRNFQARLPPEGRKPRLVVSRSHNSPRLQRLAAHLGVEEVRIQGSVGLKAGLIVEESVDLYVHASRHSSRWDICAPEAVLRGAGYALVGLRGAPYVYDSVELENSDGILAGHPTIIAKLVPTISKFFK